MLVYVLHTHQATKVILDEVQGMWHHAVWCNVSGWKATEAGFETISYKLALYIYFSVGMVVE